MPRENIDLDLIDDNPYNPRLHYKQNEVYGVAESIWLHGQLETPQARRKDGRVQLAFGGKRKRAFLENRKKDAVRFATQPLDIEDLTDEQMFFFAWEENFRRSDNTPLERARAIDHYLTLFPDKTEEEVGAKVGIKSQGTVSNMRRVLKLPQLFLDKIDEGQINFTIARELLVLNDLEDGKELMSETLSHVNTTGTKSGYNVKPATVEGVQAAIHTVCQRHFKALEALEKGGSHWYGNDDPLFDTTECMKCDKLIITHPDRSSTRHFCKDRLTLRGSAVCWEDKQRAAIEATAAAARAKMRDDVITNFTPAVDPDVATLMKMYYKPPAIPQGIPDTIEVNQEFLNETVSKSYSEGSLQGKNPKIRNPFTYNGRQWVCTFLSKVGKNVISAGCYRICKDEEVGKEKIFRTATGEDETKTRRQFFLMEPQVFFRVVPKLVDESTPPGAIPDAVLAMAKEKAGTRANVLDLKDVTLGIPTDYTHQFKQGYADLSGWRDKMDDPEECDTCTTGFHFAFNSIARRGDAEPAVYNICSNADCLAKKKGAFTRAKNAEGLARKNAERKAIKTVLDTVAPEGGPPQYGIPVLKLIVLAQLKGCHISNYAYHQEKLPKQWFWNKLSPGTEETKRTDDALWQIVNKLNYAGLVRLVTEFCFYSLQDHNTDTGMYQVKTELPLSWFGIDIAKEAAKETVDANG